MKEQSDYKRRTRISRLQNLEVPAPSPVYFEHRYVQEDLTSSPTLYFQSVFLESAYFDLTLPSGVLPLFYCLVPPLRPPVYYSPQVAWPLNIFVSQADDNVVVRRTTSEWQKGVAIDKHL